MPSNQFEKSEKKSNYLPSYVTAIAMIALVLSLFGYGMLIGIAEQFRINHGLLISNPFDLLMACWAGIMVLTSILSLDSFWSMLVSVYRYWWPIPIIMGIILFIIVPSYKYFIGRLKKRDQKKSSSDRTQKIKGWFLLSDFQILTLIAAAWPLITSVLAWVGMAVGISALSFVPLMGLRAGEKYAKTYILEPKYCVQPISRETFVKFEADKPASILGVTCVRIVAKNSDSKMDIYGRLVWATSQYAVVYDPLTGVTQKVPTENMIVLASGIDVLPVVKPEHLKN